MEVTMKIKNLVKTLALTAGIAASFSGQAAYLDFKIDETPYGGEVITADKINGGYKEIISFDAEGNFTATAFASLNQLFANEGGDDLLSGSQIGSNYSLYATFSAQGGLADPTEDGAFGALSADQGSFQLYIDPNRDTRALEGDFSRINTSDDLLLGGSESIGRNIVNFFSFGGLFDFMFYDFELNENGQNFFVSPMPFFTFVNVDGDVDRFTFEGTQRVTGDVSAIFVPEPSTLAVLGLGLLGLGASSRRKAK